MSTKVQRERVRLASKTLTGYWVKTFRDVIDRHGAPMGPDGIPLVEQAGTPGMGLEERMRRKALKETEKARVVNLTPEERAQFVAQRKQTRQAEKAQKEKDKRAALLAKLLSGIRTGELSADDPDILAKLD